MAMTLAFELPDKLVLPIGRFPSSLMAVKLRSGLTNGNQLIIGILLNNLFFFLIFSEKYLSR